MGEAQPRARHVPDEGLHVRPVQERPVAHEATQAPWQHATQPCARAGVDTYHAPPALDAGELDLAGGDQARRIGLDVDELAPEHVRTEQHLPHAALEPSETELLAG